MPCTAAPPPLAAWAHTTDLSGTEAMDVADGHAGAMQPQGHARAPVRWAGGGAHGGGGAGAGHGARLLQLRAGGCGRRRRAREAGAPRRELHGGQGSEMGQADDEVGLQGGQQQGQQQQRRGGSAVRIRSWMRRYVRGAQQGRGDEEEGPGGPGGWGMSEEEPAWHAATARQMSLWGYRCVATPVTRVLCCTGTGMSAGSHAAFVVKFRLLWRGLLCARAQARPSAG